MAESDLLVPVLEKLNLFCLTGLITLLVLEKDGSVIEEKSTFKMLRCFSSKLDWGSYIVSFANIVSEKTRDLISFLRLLSSFINVPYSLAWNNVVMVELVLLAATWIC